MATYLDQPEVWCVLPTDAAIGVLVYNFVLSRQLLYGLGAWAARFDPAPMGLGPRQRRGAGDARIGRALDELFVADRARPADGAAPGGGARQFRRGGARPATELADGNAKVGLHQAHINTWNALVAMQGRAYFVYLADCLPVAAVPRTARHPPTSTRAQSAPHRQKVASKASPNLQNVGRAVQGPNLWQNDRPARQRLIGLVSKLRHKLLGRL